MKILPFLFVCVVTRCAPSEVGPNELKAYVQDPDNGLAQVASEGDIQFETIYRPKDLVLLQEKGSLNATSWEVAAQRLKGFDYFALRISRNKKPVEESFSLTSSDRQAVVNYFSKEITSDVSLTVGNKVIKPETVFFARQFNTGNFSNLLVVFESDLANERASVASIHVNADEIGLGSHTFNFRPEDIRNIPALKKQ